MLRDGLDVGRPPRQGSLLVREQIVRGGGAEPGSGWQVARGVRPRWDVMELVYRHELQPVLESGAAVMDFVVPVLNAVGQ